MHDAVAWNLLVYKIPSRPGRLRLQIWRKLQRMGALYIQDAVCVLPSRPDLDENMQFIAVAIEELGGTCHLFKSYSALPQGDEQLRQGFRALADTRLDEILERLGEIQQRLQPVERAEEDLKRERIAYLRAWRLSYFGGDRQSAVDERLESLRQSLNALYRRPDLVKHPDSGPTQLWSEL